jgi:hypothetical protein
VLLPPQVTCAYPLFKVDLPGHEQALMAEPIGVAQPALSLWLHCETEDNTTLRGCCAYAFRGGIQGRIRRWSPSA